MGTITDNIKHIKETLPANVKLVAVSKTRPADSIIEAYRAGQTIFGENRVQELIEKADHVPSDIEWHMVGHLQRNKVKYIAGFISMIESVDSEKLLKTINKEAEKVNRTINCLLQFHIAREESKFGFSLDEAKEMLDKGIIKDLPNIKVCGVMGMATFTDDSDVVRSEFRFLKSVFDNLKNDYFTGNDEFAEISMGMSGDYKTAIEEGSTLVRLGSVIFGERMINTH